MNLIKRNKYSNVSIQDVKKMNITNKQWQRMKKCRQNKAINKYNKIVGEWDLLG